MNTMTTALHNAGVQLPSTYERVWRYFKDHPRSTSLACTQVLGLDRSNSSSYISEMETRRMLRSELIEMRVPGARGVFHNRRVKHYSVNISEFEMLPKPKRAKSTRKARAAIEAAPPEQVKPAPTPAAFDAERVINVFTLMQARAVYEELRKVFGG